MSSKDFLSYKNELNFLSSFFDLKIKKNKKSFTPVEKAKITKHINKLKSEGLISENNGKLKLDVKFTKTKSKNKIKKNKETGLADQKGYFRRGVFPDQKMKGNKIIGDFFDKVFIPIDFSNVTDPEEDEKQFDYDVRQEIISATAQYIEDMAFEDYYTLVVTNGWEVNLNKAQRKVFPKENRKKKKFAEFWEDKLSNMVRTLKRYTLTSIMRYKIGNELISGIYWYQFKNQKKKGRKNVKNTVRRKGKKRR